MKNIFSFILTNWKTFVFVLWIVFTSCVLLDIASTLKEIHKEIYSLDHKINLIEFDVSSIENDLSYMRIMCPW